MSLKKNIIANYIGLGTAALAPVLALPWYLAALGPKLFGLVAFVNTLQTVLALLDAGLSQALVREFSVRVATHQLGHRAAGALLFGFEHLYWLFAFCAAILTALVAGPISEHWLQLSGLPVLTGREAIYGAAAIFALQFPGSVYRSFLLGAQVQVPLNVVTVVCAILRHGGGIGIVMAYPSLATYLLWQAAMGLLETLTRAVLAWRTISVQRRQFRWETDEIKKVGGWVAGMSAATLLGALTVQMDKIILSRMVSVEQLGYYSIAAMVALGMLQLVYPLFQALLPHAVQMRSDPIALRQLNLKAVGLIGLIGAAVATIYCTAGQWLLQIWLKRPQIVHEVQPIITVLLIGTALNAVYNIGYIQWIVHEQFKRILQVNLLGLLLSVLLIPPFVSRYGTIGAAASWVSVNAVYLLCSTGWLKAANRFL